MVDYDKAFDRIEQLMSFFLRNGRPVTEPPGKLLAEMAPLPQAEARPGTDSYSNRLAIPFLTKWLIVRSQGARFEDPGEMLHWALMARLAAESCSAAAVGSRVRLCDLRARAWGQLGNALRVCGRLREATTAMDMAERQRESGTGDSELRARLSEKVASLQMAHWDFGTAAKLLDLAVGTYEDLGDTSALSRSLVLRAGAAHHDGQFDRSIQILNRALRLLDPLEDSELALIAQQNLAESYLEIGQPEKALILRSTTRCLRQGTGRALLIRIEWKTGKLLSRIGSLTAAEAILVRVRRRYFNLRLIPDFVYASTDLARLYKAMGDGYKLEQTLAEARELALDLKADPEFLHSLRDIAWAERV